MVLRNYMNILESRSA